MRRFTIVVPPGWVVIEPDRDVAAAAAEVARGMLRDASPRQRQLAGPLIRERLAATALELGEKDVAAVLIPATSVAELAVHPMLVVRPLTWPEDTDPVDALVALAASDPTARLLDIDHMVGLRTERVDDVTERTRAAVGDLPAALATLVAEDPTAAGRLAAVAAARQAHRVTYLIGVPNNDDSWVELTGSVQVIPDETGTELAGIMADLFDALAKSFRWTEQG